MKKTTIFLIFAVAIILGASMLGISAIWTNQSFNGEIREFEIIAKHWEFQPAIIEVNEGDLVRLKIKSIDVTHGISIPNFGINEVLTPGKTIKIELIADKKGEYNFFCSVFCGTNHREMTGKLVIK